MIAYIQFSIDLLEYDYLEPAWLQTRTPQHNFTIQLWHFQVLWLMRTIQSLKAQDSWIQFHATTRFRISTFNSIDTQNYTDTSLKNSRDRFILRLKILLFLLRLVSCWSTLFYWRRLTFITVVSCQLHFQDSIWVVAAAATTNLGVLKIQAYMDKHQQIE